MKKAIGLIILIIGVMAFLSGDYVTKQVGEGETKIKKTQKTVNQVQCTTKVNPYAKVVGQIVTNPIQQKIDEGRDEVAQYKKLVPILHIVGAFLAAIGILILFWGIFAKKKLKK
jgi:hypothetical protein